MGAGMAVAAYDRHTRLRQTEFRADYVDDALIRRIHIEERNAKVFAVFLQSFDLPRRYGIADRRTPGFGRDVVVYGGESSCGLPDSTACSP